MDAIIAEYTATAVEMETVADGSPAWHALNDKLTEILDRMNTEIHA